jgi:hypothetical protein
MEAWQNLLAVALPGWMLALQIIPTIKSERSHGLGDASR